MRIHKNVANQGHNFPLVSPGPNNGNVGNNLSPLPPMRMMREYLQPTHYSAPSCIYLPVQAQNFIIKPGML